MAFEVDPVEDLSAAVDWFVEAIGPRSPRPIRRVSDTAAVARALTDLERRVVPFGLPSELRWFWETWDPSGFDILPTPSLQDAERALFDWTLIAWEGESPRALLPVGYASHANLLMDLTGPSGRPATVWAFDWDSDLVCEAPSLAALVRACAERAEGALLDQPGAAPADTDWYGYYSDLFDGPELRAILDRHFALSSTERQRLSPDEPETWPDRWREAQRSMTGGSQPQGRTLTVAAFVALLDAGHPRARLRGALTQTTGGLESGNEYLMRLEDETGTVDLAVPPHLLAPGWGPGVDLEVEVVGRGPLPPWPQPRPPDPRKVQEMEERHGSWVGYLMSAEAATDPELAADLDEHNRALGAYKALLPLVQHTDRIDP